MPLKLHLKRGQKVIVNGAVLENIDSRAVTLLVRNDAHVLRESDVLPLERATTPALRIYYALQNLYLFPERKTLYEEYFNRFLQEYAGAVPSSRPIIDDIVALARADQLYAALKRVQELIAYEQRILGHVQQGPAAEIQRAAAGGELPGDRSLGPDPGGDADETGPDTR